MERTVKMVRVSGNEVDERQILKMMLRDSKKNKGQLELGRREEKGDGTK